MSHLVLHIVSLKFAHNYYFYADALPLTSSRSGTKFATLKLSLIKCQRASTVCFRISNYAQTYIHFIRKTKLLIHTSTLAILKQVHFSYISSVLEHFYLFSFIAPCLFFACLPKLEQLFLFAYFAPIPKLSDLSGLEHLLHIYLLYSNFHAPYRKKKAKSPRRLPRGFVFSLKTDISSAFICSLFVSITTCIKSFVHF